MMELVLFMGYIPQSPHGVLPVYDFRKFSHKHLFPVCITWEISQIQSSTVKHIHMYMQANCLMCALEMMTEHFRNFRDLIGS